MKRSLAWGRWLPGTLKAWMTPMSLWDVSLLCAGTFGFAMRDTVEATP
ncbi:MAG: hypothetical protein R3C45_21280 [Phycisphaerales bacterium]